MELKGRLKRITLHRSVSLPRELVEEAMEIVPKDVAANVNQLVAAGLRSLVERYRRVRFEREMEAMAADRALRKASRAISGAFKAAEPDGL